MKSHLDCNFDFFSTELGLWISHRNLPKSDKFDSKNHIVSSRLEERTRLFLRSMRSISKSTSSAETQNIIEKFGANIKKFHISSVSFLQSDILEILNLIPNLETLSFSDLHEGRSAERCSRETCDLNLNHLRNLTLATKDTNIINIFHRLPAGILKKFCLIKQTNEEALKNILAKTPNIGGLYCEVKVSLEAFKHLKLTELNYMVDSDDDLEIFLEQQPSLKTLTLDLNVN